MPDDASISKPDHTALQFGFENTYVHLPARFYAHVNPVPVASPRMIKLNAELALDLGLDPGALAGDEGVAVFSGNVVAEGSVPLAIAYAGHQFGHFVPQLGDGRANLLGELRSRDGRLYDVQLKGSGPTPFSRRGDGRAALGPVLREYIVSEAMYRLGVPTTRALAAVSTGERVVRERYLPGGVLTRVAASHLRVGTFQYFAALGDTDGLLTLANYAIDRHYPEAAAQEKPIRALLEEVIGRHARLVAQWMSLGFIHGVMNTDNTSISGETLDYGPCAFMEGFDPDQVYSSIDARGRYAYSNQPHAAHWNLTRLAEALLPLLAQEEGSEEAAVAAAQQALGVFGTQFEAAQEAGFRRKIGLFVQQEGDAALVEDLLDRMAASEADFTLTFRRLCDAAADPAGESSVRTLFADPTSFDVWASAWHKRLDRELMPAHERSANMRAVNPAFIPRNHLVEAVIEAAVERGDFQPFEGLLDATSQPYADRTELERFTEPARPEQRVQQTFCGT